MSGVSSNSAHVILQVYYCKFFFEHGKILCENATRPHFLNWYGTEAGGMIYDLEGTSVLLVHDEAPLSPLWHHGMYLLELSYALGIYGFYGRLHRALKV